jgi:LmbE family N-acetylglucosaminyl deacetylase
MKILFIFAHPDDEAFGPAGTIMQLAETNDVSVVSLCNGERPGNEHVAEARIEAFKKSCETMKASWRIYSTPDCALTYDDTLKTIETIINQDMPDVVYTHNISDIHRDHRLVAECCMVACRPKVGSSIKELYMCELPASTDWSFGQIEPVFTPNVYRDITDVIEIKKDIMSLYGTEVYEYPDARSIESMRAMAKNRGRQAGVEYSEAFKLVFSLPRKNP